MSECIRLLSRPVPSAPYAPSVPNTHDPPDPFSDPTTAPTIYYSTTGTDSFRSPSLCHPHLNAHSWIHIFPEGRIHQHPTRALRYFKWGIARLILESEPLPQVVPIWIEGLDGVMHESRGPPRWVPRIGQDVKVVFGKEVDGEGLFGGLRKEWRELVERDGKQAADEEEREGMESKSSLEKKMSEERLGADLSPRLKYGDDAVKLRIEVSRRVREEIVKLRRGMGWPDEDPKAGLAETWRVEGDAGKRDGRMEDGSWVRDV
ncbi:MAG: hypothetical protein M1837_006202 [Sclerophora amabilis]|nr:MAG: hypothetical protein M1837_006202 [Sclerophora amabilis]